MWLFSDEYREQPYLFFRPSKKLLLYLPFIYINMEKNQMSVDLSFVIPAYNEEYRIGMTLKTVIEYFAEQDYSTEIIVVDDGSNDKTTEICAKFPQVRLLCQPQNMGKGAAVRRGMLEANGEYCLFSDADLSTPIYETSRILNELSNGYDVCIGSRAIESDLIRKHQPFYREFMGKTFNKIVQMLVFKGINDTQCGFKGFSKLSVQAIFPLTKIDGFGFDVEILYLATKFQFKIKELPVEWYNDERSKVNPITDSLKMFLEVLKIRRIHK
ncbi:MAG: glycosyltransferase family 2 protein [Candidatus Kapabacteria bacterium]|nr:glycosyltransferase family 2 protein [Candidatus Kapabacteria bacterium]